MSNRFKVLVKELPTDVKTVHDILFDDIEKNKDRYDIDERENDGVSLITYEFGVTNGKVDPFDDDSHYGLVILSDEDSEYWVRTMMFLGGIKEDIRSGWLTIEKEMISIEY